MRRHSDNEVAADLWTAFVQAESVQAFCKAWLGIQCRLIEQVEAGLLLTEQDKQTYGPAAVWPDPRLDFTYLGHAAQRCLSERRGLVDPDGPARVIVACPVEVGAYLYGAVVLHLAARSEHELQEVLRQLHWGAGWLEALFRRQQAERDEHRLARARIALDLVAVAGERQGLHESALGIANELAARLGCTRVSIGLERKGRSRLVALSHSAWFDKNSQLVRSVENAMDEAFDQRKTVVVPSIEGLPHAIAVAHLDLVGQGAACSVVVSSRGRNIGVITFERAPGEAFSAVDTDLCEAAASLLGPMLELKHEARRWFAGRVADGARSFGSALADPRRPSMRLATAAVVLSLLFLLLANGEYRVPAKAVLEGEVQRATVAPFDGYIAEAFVRAGQAVKRGQMLARLDDRDLSVERQKWASERAQHEGKYRDALAKHDRTGARVLAAQIAESEAQLDLVEERLVRARMTAPFDGLVVTGDLSQMLGSPVQQGKVLFEIAPLDAYRVILKVDERDIRSVAIGQTGQLVLTGINAEPLPLVVTNISVPSAEDGHNYFRVEAQLQSGEARLRPGMEGVGKITAGERRLAWIWTHRFIDWLRIQAWTWLP